MGQGEIVHLRVSICSWRCARHLKDVCLASDSLEIMPGSSVELSEAQWSSVELWSSGTDLSLIRQLLKFWKDSGLGLMFMFFPPLIGSLPKARGGWRLVSHLQGSRSTLCHLVNHWNHWNHWKVDRRIGGSFPLICWYLSIYVNVLRLIGEWWDVVVFNTEPILEVLGRSSRFGFSYNLFWGWVADSANRMAHGWSPFLETMSSPEVDIYSSEDDYSPAIWQAATQCPRANPSRIQSLCVCIDR